MPALDAVKAAIAAVDEDLTAVEARKGALEAAKKDLASALKALEGADAGATGSRRSSGSRSTSSRSSSRGSGGGPPRPTVTPDDLVGAVRELGGTATVEQLVEQLGLPDGRSLNGARRQAVDAERVAYADRVYSLPSADPRWPEEAAGDAA